VITRTQAVRTSENGSVIENVVADLERDGVVCCRICSVRSRLKAMQQAVNARLNRLRWNSIDGCEKTEP